MGPIGAGGMGEVYRARDPRLRRDVALKVLHPGQANSEQVQRLTREARATGALNHPNIVAVFDVGAEGDTPYVVSELLEGESLRHRLDRGSLPTRKAIDYGIQIAQALAAAHDKGICHRDVKPGNVFITTDGRIKLLDFGLAKLLESSGGLDDTTASALSRPDLVCGTVGYMAPEQVLGEPIDYRADVFALGAVLYEMLTGARAFQRSSTVETMVAILREDPVSPLELNPTLSPAAVATVRRCLEKKREERFQSARDLAFHLQQLEQSSSGSLPRTVKPAVGSRSILLLGVAAAVAIAATAWLTHELAKPRPSPSPSSPPSTPSPVYQQLTFKRGRIGSARLTGTGVVYSQAVEKSTPDVWLLRTLEQHNAQPTRYRNADVLATRPGQVALCTERRLLSNERYTCQLKVVHGGLEDGDRVEVLAADVEGADWDPLGNLVIARAPRANAPSKLEYMGRPLYSGSSGASIRSPRFSPDGRRVAFLEDRNGVGSGGNVVVVDLQTGRDIPLTDAWESVVGLDWSPDGREVWFAAARSREPRQLQAVDLDRRQRTVLAALGSLTLWDVSSDGRVLLAREEERRFLMGKVIGDAQERDFACFDAPGLASLSANGKLLLFKDRFGICIRPTDGSRVETLPLEGFPDDLSPDGTQVLATPQANQLMRIMRKDGSREALSTLGIEVYKGAHWLGGTRRIVFNGREGDSKQLKAYVLDTDTDVKRDITPAGVTVVSVSPDATRVAAIDESGDVFIHGIDDSRKFKVQGTTPGDRPEGWSADGKWLWMFRKGEVPTQVYALEIATGNRRPGPRLAPPDPVGVYSINAFKITSDGQSYFYNYSRVLSELYLVRGLR